jgi:hypothetical protein
MTVVAAQVSTASTEDVPALESLCTADCGEHADVSCEAASCSAVNRNCSAGEQGYVVCNGVYTYCPGCPGCVEGEIQLVPTGECCINLPRELADLLECIGGEWVLQPPRCIPSTYCMEWPLVEGS